MMRNFVIWFLFSVVSADVYLHNPRGSNNRLDETGRGRANGNRMFDSQNNNRGGYNVGSVYYYEGSVLSIEWTNQHSCGEKNSQCELILQYMCDSQLRDGVTVTTIPDNRAKCDGYDCNADMRYGMNENFEWYTNCKYRERNKGLFTADQKLKGEAAQYTRQNPGGTRRGYECPEERDYFPYWQPTPWKDIAIMTNDVSRCEYYMKESQNVKDKYACIPPPGYMEYLMKGRGPRNTRKLLGITKENCEAIVYKNITGKWEKKDSWDLTPPECIVSPRSRDNHNGNGLGAFPLTYNWTIPNQPHEHCTLRLRYNISTDDYDGWNTNASFNTGRQPSKVDIGALVGLHNRTDAVARGYIFKNNPVVQPLYAGKNNKIGKKLQLQLAINTAQYGRVFQDRSHSFAIRARPEHLKEARIHNLNVRGKRGNIVQVYPAVEYDFVPNRLQATVGDHIHIQWTGSNTNPENNDGQGLRGTDRSNIVVLTPQQYPEGALGRPVPESLKNGHFGNSYPGHLHTVNFLGFPLQDLKSLAILTPGQLRGELSELDDAGTYFDLGPRRITKAGTFHYMCSRNNNFSNRSQKGKIVTTKYAVQEKMIGWSGGSVQFGESEGVWVKKGVLSQSKQIRIEKWSPDDGETIISSNGGMSSVGDNYESSYVAVYPFDEIAGGQAVTIKMKVDSTGGTIYHSSDYKTWEKVPDIQYDGMVANIQTSRGGLFVSKSNNKSKNALILGLVVAAVVIILLVTGTCIYFNRRPNARQNFQKKFFMLKLSTQSQI